MFVFGNHDFAVSFFRGVVIGVMDTVVMFHGSVQGELVGDEMNEQAIMRLATGGQV